MIDFKQGWISAKPSLVLGEGGLLTGPLRPRRRTTKTESSASHRKSSPRGPRAGFSSATEEAAAATKATMKLASQFQLSPGFPVPLGAARTRRGWAARYDAAHPPSPAASSGASSGARHLEPTALRGLAAERSQSASSRPLPRPHVFFFVVVVVNLSIPLLLIFSKNILFCFVSLLVLCLQFYQFPSFFPSFYLSLFCVSFSGFLSA